MVREVLVTVNASGLWSGRPVKGNFLKNEKKRRRKPTMWDLKENGPTGTLGGHY